jgi:hypothetical protein
VTICWRVLAESRGEVSMAFVKERCRKKERKKERKRERKYFICPHYANG